jgi:hypothetical protein
MTEAEWLACDDPRSLLEFLRGRTSARKLRLFACACCRRVWGSFGPPKEEALRHAFETAERAAEHRATVQDLEEAFDLGESVVFLDDHEEYPAVAAARPDAWEAADETALALRDYFGVYARNEAWEKKAREEVQNAVYRQAQAAEGREQVRLLRDLVGNPFRVAPVLDPAWMAWNDGVVRRLAEAIYKERAYERLPILADALEEAGCTDADLLGHLRGPGPHARGCWALDLLIGRD